MNFFLDGGTMRCLYSFLKLGLGGTIGNARRRSGQIVPKTLLLTHISHTDVNNISEVDLKGIAAHLGVTHECVKVFFDHIDDLCCTPSPTRYFWFSFICRLVKEWARQPLPLPACFQEAQNANRDYRKTVDSSQLYEVSEIYTFVFAVSKWTYLLVHIRGIIYRLTEMYSYHILLIKSIHKSHVLIPSSLEFRLMD